MPAGRDVPLDLALERRPVAMPGIFARVVARQLSVPGMTRDGFRPEGETELRALDSSPGVAEAGITVGGRLTDPNDPASVLYVRGAASDLKLVLLDGGPPVYAPFHLGGLLDAFPDGVLRDASLYIGGTPARYDGGLSYVLDLEIREGGCGSVPDRGPGGSARRAAAAWRARSAARAACSSAAAGSTASDIR